VFFRAFVRDAAVAAGVSGWAANLRDGSVEVHAEGDEEGVDAVLAAARSGSPQSSVEDVVVREVPVEGCSGFESR
jgi:acylphosphatase